TASFRVPPMARRPKLLQTRPTGTGSSWVPRWQGNLAGIERLDDQDGLRGLPHRLLLGGGEDDGGAGSALREVRRAARPRRIARQRRGDRRAKAGACA